jgi:hypothetical protein
MSHFESFDSMEEMFARMEAAEREANEGLLPQQIEIRDDTEHPRYWVRPYEGFLIFGHALSEEEVLATEGPGITHEVMTRRRRGYLFGWCYSEIEPSGEVGDTHVANLMPISETAFLEAKAHGWRAVAPDRAAELMVPAEVLAQKCTLTLVAELRVIDALVRGS